MDLPDARLGCGDTHPLDSLAPFSVRKRLSQTLSEHGNALASAWSAEVDRARLPSLALPHLGRDVMMSCALKGLCEYLHTGRMDTLRALFAEAAHRRSAGWTVAQIQRALDALCLVLLPRLGNDPASAVLMIGMLDAAALCAADAVEHATLEERRQTEERSLRFFQRVTRLATRDRLRFVEPDELPAPRGDALPISHPEDSHVLRLVARQEALALGMPSERVEDLVLAVGEATANVCKHAGCGQGKVWVDNGTIFVWISDNGRGIALDDLPHATLSAGWSTEVSLGMGFTLMLETSDALWLSTGPEGTTVCIEKAVHAAPPLALGPLMPLRDV